ncbi:response regulator [Kangiella sp. TOML190]|uniref:response regulator n=1 Tax=Kangiella sp. TOML190 TaxID=2931351 RepID=UPI00203A39FD|nr:response regulator [Kangiella sp. TOML190]
MKKLLLLDDDKKYLAETVKELKLAGCDITYLNSGSQALEFVEQHKSELGMIIIALNNALGYPTVRKVKRAVQNTIDICIYSDSGSTSLREWVYRQQINAFFTAPFEKDDLIDDCKRIILKKNIHFSHKQLLGLTEVLAKYTDSADNLVQKHAANSNSIQELQHKLARSLTNFEHQKNFLTEVQ